MKDKEILDSVKRTIDQAPIDILENIKKAPRTKMLRHDEITKQKTGEKTFKKFMPYVSAAAAFVLVFFGWQYQTKMADSSIYIDVNPSIEITTNRLNKVIDIKSENQDGKLLIEEFDHKGMTIEEVAEEVLDRMIDEKYLDKDHKFLLLSVYNKNKEKAESQKLDLDKKIHEYLQNKELQPIVLSQKLDNTSTIANYAKEYGVSVSKMTFIRNLIILNPEFQTEKLVDLSIEELVRLSQDMELELDKIIDSIDFERIRAPQYETEDLPPEIPSEENDDDDDDDDEEEDDDDDNDDDDNDDDDDEDDYDDDDDNDDEDDEDDDDNDDDDDEIVQQNNIISSDQAKNIALSVANGNIKDSDYDEEDMEYEFKIEVGELEYEITIDAITGEVHEVEIED